MQRLIGFALLPLLLTAGVAQAQVPNSSQPPQGTGTVLNYPTGTRVYPNGTIVSPRSEVTIPNVTIRNGNGTTTYYYPNGTKLTTPNRGMSPAGTFLTPGLNGGLGNGQNRLDRLRR